MLIDIDANGKGSAQAVPIRDELRFYFRFDSRLDRNAAAYYLCMDVKEILAIGLPTVTVLVGILLNRSDSARLDARITTEVAALRSTLTGEVAALRSTLTGEVATLRSTLSGEVNSLRANIREIRADLKLARENMREFYRSLGQHEVRLDNIEKK